MAEEHTQHRDRNGTPATNGWRPETADRTLPVTYLPVRHGLGDLPKPEPCPLCKARMEQTVVPYWVEGSRILILAPDAPGYACTNCGAELYDPLIDVELVTGAAALLEPVADADLRAILYERAAELCRSLAPRKSRRGGPVAVAAS